MKQLAALWILILAHSGVSAQYFTNQNKIWTFGNHAGVDFTSGAPVSFSTPMLAAEGCASVCDTSGHLLFYTNGKSVWNRTNTIMPSAASITPYDVYSTTQAAVIVPVLSNPYQYYVFSLEQENDTPGSPYIYYSHLTYSIVDMTLDGGLGDIIPSTAGILLDSLLSEKMIVVRGNNCNMWLIVHKRTTAVFQSYEITASGVNSIPVLSTTGSFPMRRGVMKVSPDRQRIVSCGADPHATELFDFDATTGIVSNARLLDMSQAYGGEFSPDNTKLYLGKNYYLAQYDISLPTTAAIIASETIIDSGTRYDMKLGPDNKMYFVSRGTSGYLDCLNYPNLAGSSSGFVYRAVTLLSLTSLSYCMLGMPGTYWSIPPAVITGAPSLCAGTVASFSAASSGGSWSSSDTGVATVSAGGNVYGVAAGTAVISYADDCNSAAATVTVNPSPVITGSSNLCIGRTIILSSDHIGGTWTSGSPAIATVDTLAGIATGVSAGSAVITYALNACAATLTLTLAAAPDAGIIYGVDSICGDHMTMLSDSVAGGVWSSSDTSIANVSPGVGIVTGISPGVVTISYTVINICDTATAVKYIYVLTPEQCMPSEGIAGAAAGNGIELFPNPNSGSFFLMLTAPGIYENAYVEVFNMIGERIKGFVLAANKTEEVSMEGYKGLFTLFVTTPQGRYCRKVLIN